MKYKKLMSNLYGVVSRLDYVELFCMMGSVAEGTDTKESDIDFYVLLKNLKYKSHFLSQVSSILKTYGEQKHYFVYNEKRISIHIHSTSEINAKINDLFRDKKTFLDNEWVARGYVIEAIPIYNPKNIFEKYQKKVSNYPQRIKKQIIKENLSFLGTSIHYLKRGIRSPYYLIECLGDELKAIYRIIYALNEEYYLVSAKRVHNDLKHLKPDIKSEMDFIVKETNTQPKMNKKLEFLQKIYNKLKRASSK